jgi:hypothetical protein
VSIPLLQYPTEEKETTMKRVCQYCGEEFPSYPSRVKDGKGKYCSKECSKAGIRKEKPRICLACGEELYARPAFVKKGGGKYCSSKCFGRRHNKENNPNWRGGKIRKICDVCGAEFQIHNWEEKRGGGNFCSQKCYALWQSRNMRGENNPSWKGGITDIGSRVRGSLKYEDWKQNIFIRDDFTCQRCGQHGGDLEAHHRKAFSKLMQEARDYMPLLDPYTACILYTPMWDISNGQTLCKGCHKANK